MNAVLEELPSELRRAFPKQTEVPEEEWLYASEKAELVRGVSKGQGFLYSLNPRWHRKVLEEGQLLEIGTSSLHDIFFAAVGMSSFHLVGLGIANCSSPLRQKLDELEGDVYDLIKEEGFLADHGFSPRAPYFTPKCEAERAFLKEEWLRRAQRQV